MTAYFGEAWVLCELGLVRIEVEHKWVHYSRGQWTCGGTRYNYWPGTKALEEVERG